MTALSLFAAIAMAMQANPHPLPDRVDIPDRYSTVICPSTQAATTMIDKYYGVRPAPNNFTTDTALFFKGLEATGCTQDAARPKGHIVIQSVSRRTTLEIGGEPERFIAYRGIHALDRTPVIGIVSEDGNNGFARTELADWLQARSQDGWLDARDGQSRAFYRCDTPQQARMVVAGLQGQENATAKGFDAKFNRLAAAHKCRVASDRYIVLAILGNATNNCGTDCLLDLTALEARDRSGSRVGLIFDGSQL